MKKILFFGAIALMLGVNAFAGEEGNDECPNRCGNNNQICCKTKGGSIYYGGIQH
ncbi:hypothetical protein QQY79_20380 [Flavobacterium tructae]|uniref:hypothetical protein n=1 Tax=Flavobacterium TaxID=237 RepID=UPI00201F75FC|nr:MULTISPECIES: hypothetical protein [Flavobacterium]MDL2144892.1 hypothetical protein [Flavobacterium tructae]URC14578.1 hypothetical protein M4I44_09365 [Flavobacterium sp. B183]